MMRKEIRRQLVHAIFGTVVLAFLLAYGKISALLTSFAFGLGLIVSVISSKGKKLPFFSYALQEFGRENESIAGFGALTFFLGLTMAIAFFPQKAAIGAVVILIYGDAASTVFGIKFGRNKTIGNYTVEGTAAGIIVSFVALSFFFKPGIAFIASIIGMLAELLPGDDNITIPVVSGVVLSLMV